MGNQIQIIKELDFLFVRSGWENDFRSIIMEFYEWDISYSIQHEDGLAVPKVEELLEQDDYTRFADTMASEELFDDPNHFEFLSIANESEEFYELSSYYWNFLLNDAISYLEWHHVLHLHLGEYSNFPIMGVW